MDEQEWARRLTELGCLYPYDPSQRRYHFVGDSGAHLGGYCNLDPLLCETRLLWEVTGQIATEFGSGGNMFDKDDWPEVVAAPAVGEIAMLHPLAQQLVHVLPVSDVPMVWADRVSSPPGQPAKFKMVRTGFAKKVYGKRVLVVVDFLNTGHSAARVMDEVARHGGRPVGVCAVAYNRDPMAILEDLCVPAFYGLTPFTYPIWQPDDCAAEGPCAQGVPIVIDPALGHGAEFRAQHPELPRERFVQLLPDYLL